MSEPFDSWVVCQIGAREHYAIPRALHRNGNLARLISDFWVPPASWTAKLARTQRLRDRFHPDISESEARAFNSRMLAFEALQKVRHTTHWNHILHRNQFFQKLALTELKKFSQSKEAKEKRICLFSYSYAALDLFRFAKQCGWYTVLGQIDPGPPEEQIVQQELKRVGTATSRWQPAPSDYWSQWREETEIADRILVNSNWSQRCLVETGIPESKMEIIPLVYAPPTNIRFSTNRTPKTFTPKRPLRLLFLGQVNIRKGVARLLDAMRLLECEPIELVLAGPTDMDPMLWKDRSNVRYLGPLARSDVGKFYRNSDLFILPTLSDGFAITQLEALAYGIPVIASKNCGDVVVHGQNGLLLDSVEPDAIAKAIKTFAADPIILARNSTRSFELPDLAAALIRSVQ